MTDTREFVHITHISKYIKLFPQSLQHNHQWAEIRGASPAGMIFEITRVTGRGGLYEVGEVHFLSWDKLLFKYVTIEEAKK